VKLEQASKVKSWMLTRLNYGEGHVDREDTELHLFRSTGVMSTACQEGGLGNWGRPGSGGGSHLQRCLQGQRSDRETERAVGASRPGNAGGAKGPRFWCVLLKKERIGDWR
jgi:hypothetical protein